MKIRNGFLSLICIGIIVVGFLYFFQNRSTPTPINVKPKITLSPEEIVDDNGPKVGLNLTLSPVFLNIVLNPNQQATAQFKVINNNPFQEEFKLNIIKFKADVTGSKPTPVEVTNDDEILKLVKFSEDTFKIQPNETKQLSFTFNSPKNAELGYYFAVMVTRTKERQARSREAILAGAPSLPVLIEVRNPKAKKQAELVSFKTKSGWFEYLPVEFETEMKNTGTVHLVPFGDIFIDQGNNKEIGTAFINEVRGNILPQTKRTYTSSWSDGFIIRTPKMQDGQYILDKNGKLVYETKWDITKLDKFRIGKYTATAIMVYNDGEKDIPLEAKTTFWVIPWKIIIVFIAILFLLFQGIKSSLQNLGLSVKGKNK